MISHHHKCIFIHIPKNAGQSIEHAFLNLLDLDWNTRAPLLLRYNEQPELGPPRLAHLRAHEYIKYKYISQEIFDQYYKFSFVRNPWSRMISFYKYLGFEKKSSFNDFVQNDFRKKLFKEKYWFIRPQHEFIYHEGRLLVDFVGKFESLQEDFNILCEAIGLEPTSIPHVNKSETPIKTNLINPLKIFSRNKNSDKVDQTRKSYQEYYDHNSVEIIEELYGKDIDLFDYQFEE